MNFEFAEKINPFLIEFDYEKALSIAESSLNEIPKGIFHNIIGKSLLHHTDELSLWINDFYFESLEDCDVESFFFTIIEFDINIETWLIDGFGFSRDGGIDDYEWLCDVETGTAKPFILTGFEKLQFAFQSYEQISQVLKEEDLEQYTNARDWCEQIIIIRFMELMRLTHLLSKEKNMSWSKLPIYFSEHEYDFIVKSKL